MNTGPDEYKGAYIEDMALKIYEEYGPIYILPDGSVLINERIITDGDSRDYHRKEKL